MLISIVIPTIGRYDSLNRLLESFLLQTKKIGEIVIVDQAEYEWNNLQIWKDKLPIVYIHTGVCSLPKARNLGVSHSKGDVVGFLDDDIVLLDGYIEHIHSFFEKHPNALGVQGVIENFVDGHVQKVGGNFLYKVYSTMSHFFLLNSTGRENKIFLSGRNLYAVNPTSVISSQWLSGIANYRRNVFDSFKFDENLRGYALGEDKMFSYGIFSKNPNALFTDPAIRCQHFHASGGRPTSSSWAQMKVYYTYYFWYKYFSKRYIAWLAFWWANMWDVVLLFISGCIGKQSFSSVFWHVVYYAQVFLCPSMVRKKICK